MSDSNREHRSLIDLTLRNRQFMRVAPLCVGAMLNAILAFYNGVVGFTQSLLWEQTMAVYFAILCFMGSYVAACMSRPERHSMHTVMRVCGGAIIVLAIALGCVKYRTIGEAHHSTVNPYIMVLLAAVSFAVAAVTIVGAHKARSGDGYQQAFLRVSLACMLGAMIVTEVQMIGTFAESGDASRVFAIEVGSGAVFVLLLLLMGSSLILKSRDV